MSLKIGTVARMTGLSPSGIRFLEEQGVLTPSGGRKGTYRNYTLADVSAVLEYRNYRKCGLSQEEILKVFNGQDVTEIFEQHCDDLERQIMEKTRLLHFLRHRNREMAQIQNMENRWEITERPAIVWLPAPSAEESPEWPRDNGFEIPYTDSVLLFDRDILSGPDQNASMRLGIGMQESSILNASFLDMKGVRYFKKHPALQCIVEITSDFLITEDSLQRVRTLFPTALAQSGYIVDETQPIITKRIMTTKRNGITQRFDHLWIGIQ
ncbi:MAG: MerR family transcriptional regulator [Oscillospiraceae bacterium]|nr:MerR family transcriptional regulator [Oscillospiraceae bacterium]